MKALWGVRIFLQLNVVALPKWLYAGLKTVILNTHKRNIYWKITHSCKKNWSLLCDSKNPAMWQNKTKSL